MTLPSGVDVEIPAWFQPVQAGERRVGGLRRGRSAHRFHAARRRVLRPDPLPLSRRLPRRPVRPAPGDAQRCSGRGWSTAPGTTPATRASGRRCAGRPSSCASRPTGRSWWSWAATSSSGARSCAASTTSSWTSWSIRPTWSGCSTRCWRSTSTRSDHVIEAVGDIVDIIRFGDDLGMDNGPLMSPDTYRAIFKPRHAALNAYVHERSSTEDVPALLWLALRPAAGHHRDRRGHPQPGADLGARHGAREAQGRVRRRHHLLGWRRRHAHGPAQGHAPSEVKDHVRRNIEAFAPGGGFVFGRPTTCCRTSRRRTSRPCSRPWTSTAIPGRGWASGRPAGHVSRVGPPRPSGPRSALRSGVSSGPCGPCWSTG